MQWYEKDPCFHRSFSTGTKMKQSKNYLVCSRRCFPIFTTTEYHGFSLYTVQNEEIQIFPLLMHSWPGFFELPTPFPKTQKTFWKIGAVYADLIHARALSGFKIWIMQQPQHRHVNGFNNMIVIYLLLCWNIFQHALLKAFFHNMSIALLIERAHVLIYSKLQQLQHTLDHAHPFHMFKCVSCLPGSWSKTTKKRTLTTSIHVYFTSLLTTSYKTERKH